MSVFAVALLIAAASPVHGKNIDDDFSACVPASSDPATVCDFSVAVERDKEGNKQILLSRKVRMVKGQPQYAPADEIAYPSSFPKASLVGATASSCALNGKNDEQVIALAEFDDTKEFSTRVRAAWQLDEFGGRLMELRPENVRCENPGFGL